jgi:oxygen-dependent protoporphyrinogen oxidase
VTPPRSAVIGGGISGLTAALRLQQQHHDVTVFEATERVGGKIRTDALAGIAIEEGADAFLPRDDAALDLCRDLGLGEQLVSPAVFGAYIWSRGGLRALPPGSPYGIPRSPAAARRAGLLSPWGAARASLEFVLGRPLRGPDTSVADLVRARFGSEVLERMVDPMMAGIRGGRTDHMSLAAATREIDALARNHRSILGALRAQGPPEPPRFLAPSGGMQRLIDELAARVPNIKTGVSIDQITRAGTGFTVAGETFDGVVVAAPTFAAADIVAELDEEVARLLEAISYASLAVVTLVYPPAALDIPRGGSGVLVPSGAGLTISACTWYSTKWPWVVTDDRIVVRCVIGRAGRDPGLQVDDDELLTRARRDLEVIHGSSAEPTDSLVTRWDRAIPQYEVGHLELVDGIDAGLARSGAIVVTGAGYRGSGIPDCIAQANSAAERLGALVQAGGG